MLNLKELNQIIKEMNEIKEMDLPYCKGMINREPMIKILKKYTEYDAQ